MAQEPTKDKKEKPANPPPYANQPATGIAPPPEGTTPHDTPKLDQGKTKGKKRPGKKKPAAKNDTK